MIETAITSICPNKENGYICLLYLNPTARGLFIGLLSGIILMLCHIIYKATVHYQHKKAEEQIPENNDDTGTQYRPRHVLEHGILNRRRRRNRQNTGNTEGIPTETPPADYRATGDCWDSEDIDPDYDFNNDMMVLMLHEIEDNPNNEEEEEENQVVRRIILAETDEEARELALENLEEISGPAEQDLQAENAEIVQETDNETQGNVELAEN